ncbi:hypothetical protein [Bradyrhizobium sp. 1]|uniref:hypothetical protein n=1 Tax=Bradyrhizobium sp. 1 TaxID=241591 RepID=UPI001FF7E160|nr:hypothetical protein [Bradyrhizobium sp. 1]MCK1393538.1 hypothetical protein [Bradyrhizobium sp. 1]
MIDALRRTGGSAADLAPGAALLALVLASLCLLRWLLLLCNAGFDLTDEGFYLNWLSGPANYSFSVSQFGFVYHPLYKLLGGDVVLLRSANLLISFALGWVLCFAIMQQVCDPWRSASWGTRVAVMGCAFAVATASLSFFALWQPTPNYNSLVFQALMIVATGLILMRRRSLSLLAWLLIGIGGGAAFLGKPTSAVAAAVVVLLYATIAGRLEIKGLLVAAATAVMVLVGAALLIDASIWDFIERNRAGLEMGNLLLPFRDGILTSFRWEFLHFSDELSARFDYLAVAYLTLTTVCCAVTPPARVSAALIVSLSSALSVLVLVGSVSNEISNEPAEPYLFLAGAIGVAAAAVALGSRTWPSRDALAIICAFSLLPFAFVAGTNTNGWMAAGRAGFFWLLIGLVASSSLAVARRTWHPLLAVGSLSLLGTTIVLYLATEHPYRQLQPLRLQQHAAEVGTMRSQLRLSEQGASLISALQRLAGTSGFEAGQPVLDLTGVSPGLLYALGARSLGVAWVSGGYPGTVDFVTAGLRLESCAAIGVSWILSAPEQPDSIAPDFLRKFGIDVGTDYQEAGNIDSVLSFAPFSKIRYRLLKPARSPAEASLACERDRGK